MTKKPLVTVGVTTYNRKDLLKKNLDYIINQTYKNLEIVICDNHSEDGTEALCLEYAAKDPRIKYFRHDKNIGMTANGNFALTKIEGEFFTSVCDDDWISENFVEECIKFFQEHPDYVLVSGHEKLYYPDLTLVDDVVVAKSLDQDSYFERIHSYIDQVWSLAIPGVIRTADLKKHGDFKGRICEDWVLMIKFAFLGKWAILENCTYHKLWAGNTSSFENIAETFNLSVVPDFNGVMDLYAQTCEDSILNDEFYLKILLKEQDRIELATFIHSLISARKRPIQEQEQVKQKQIQDPYIVNLLKYIWRHPLFLFRKKFYNLLMGVENE